MTYEDACRATWSLRDRLDLSTNLVALIMAYIDEAEWPSGRVQISQEAMGEKIGRTLKTAHEQTKDLVRLGILTPVDDYDRSRAYTYKVNTKNPKSRSYKGKHYPR